MAEVFPALAQHPSEGRLKAIEDRLAALEARPAPYEFPVTSVVLPDASFTSVETIPSDPRPWEAEGISRRTWYRRQKDIGK